MANTYQNN